MNVQRRKVHGNYGSNAELFAKRGDPWTEISRQPYQPKPLSDLEGRVDRVRRKYDLPPVDLPAEQRVVTPENPEMDRYTRADRAAARRPLGRGVDIKEADRRRAEHKARQADARQRRIAMLKERMGKC